MKIMCFTSSLQQGVSNHESLILMLYTIYDTITLATYLLNHTLNIDRSVKWCTPHTDSIIQRIFLFQRITNEPVVWYKMAIYGRTFLNNRISCNTTFWSKDRLSIYYMIKIDTSIYSYIRKAVTVKIIEKGTCLVLPCCTGITDTRSPLGFTDLPYLGCNFSTDGKTFALSF